MEAGEQYRAPEPGPTRPFEVRPSIPNVHRLVGGLVQLVECEAEDLGGRLGPGLLVAEDVGFHVPVEPHLGQDRTEELSGLADGVRDHPQPVVAAAEFCQ